MKKPFSSLVTLCAMFLAACSPTATANVTPTFIPQMRAVPTETTSTIPPTITFTPTTIITPAFTITPSAIATFSPHPLALDLSNAATDMKKLTDFGHGTARDLAWAPDGKTLAVASDSGVYFYDTHTWAEIDTIPDATVLRLTYSPDGGFLALAKNSEIALLDYNSDSEILVWNTKSKSFERQMEGKLQGWAQELIYDSAGRIAALGIRSTFGGSTAYAKAWDASTGKEIFAKGDMLINDYPFSVDIDIQGEPQISLSYDQNPARQAIIPDSSLQATVKDGAVIVRDAKTNDEIVTLNFNDIDTLAVGLVDMGTSEKYLAATGSAFIMLWDLETGALVQKIDPQARVITLEFSPDRRTLASLDENRLLRLWDIPSGKQTFSFDLVGQVGRKMKFRPDGARLIFENDADQTLLDFNLQTGQLKPFETQLNIPIGAYITSVPFFYTSTGHLMSWGYQAKAAGYQLILLDFSSGKETETSYTAVSDMTDFVEEMTFNPDMNLMAFGVSGAGGEADPTIRVYDLQGGKIVRSIKTGNEAAFWDGGTGGISSLAFSPVSDLLVSIGYDGITCLWNIHTGNPLRILNNKNKRTAFMAFTPDGRFLVITDGGLGSVWGIPAK